MTINKKSITLVMPAYNEEDRLPATLNEYVGWIEQNSDLNIELIVVNDGSSDKTKNIVQSYINEHSWIRLINCSHVGMMNAIIIGIKNAKHNFIGTVEADNSVNPEYFKSFLPYMADNDILIGSRFLGINVKGKSFIRRIISKVNSRLFEILFTCPVKDPQISFRLYKKKCIMKVLPLIGLKHDGFKCTEIVVKAHSLGFRLKEMPVVYTHNIDSKAVPNGIKMVKVTALAVFALFQLWIQSLKEYKEGILPLCPVIGGKIIDYIIGK